MKICSTCKIEYDYSYFYKNRNNIDGLHYQCKSCMKAFQKSRCGQLIQDRYNMSEKGERVNQRKSQKCEATISRRYKKQQYNRSYRFSEHGRLIINNCWERYKKTVHGNAILRQRDRRRRELKNLFDSNYTIYDEQYTHILFGQQCFNCYKTSDLVIDHHYPLSKGFGLSLDNAVLLCGSCNGSKGGKMPKDFYSQNQLQKLEYILAIGSCEDLGVY